jgi:hypothetical protein
LTKVVNKKKATTKTVPAASEEPPQVTRFPHPVCNLSFQTTRCITQLLRSGRPFLCVLTE